MSRFTLSSGFLMSAGSHVLTHSRNVIQMSLPTDDGLSIVFQSRRRNELPVPIYQDEDEQPLVVLPDACRTLHRLTAQGRNVARRIIYRTRLQNWRDGQPELEEEARLNGDGHAVIESRELLRQTNELLELLDQADAVDDTRVTVEEDAIDNELIRVDHGNIWALLDMEHGRPPRSYVSWFPANEVLPEPQDEPVTFEQRERLVFCLRAFMGEVLGNGEGSAWLILDREHHTVRAGGRVQRLGLRPLAAENWRRNRQAAQPSHITSSNDRTGRREEDDDLDYLVTRRAQTATARQASRFVGGFGGF